MPNRVLRDWTDSEKVDQLSVHAERFFTRLIMKADDYGLFSANTGILKASLYPLKLDSIRETDISRWLTECENTTNAKGQKSGLIVVYEVEGKRYLQITDFKQRLDKARAKHPLPIAIGSVEVGNEFRSESETESEVETEIEKPNGLGNSAGRNVPPSPQVEYENLKKEKKLIVAFIRSQKPSFIDPFIDLWNIFSEEKKLAKVQKITDTRKKKFAVRIKEQQFDFLAVLKKAASSQFLLTGGWFCFDWIIENESNYLKVIEGNYDEKQNQAEQSKHVAPAPVFNKSLKREINYLYDKYRENEQEFSINSIEEIHFKELNANSKLECIADNVDEIRTSAIKQLNGSVSNELLTLMMKKICVIEFFKNAKRKGDEIIFTV